MQITHLDHLVMTVHDIDRTCTFYADILGMEIKAADNKRTSLHFGSCKINLHQSGKEYSPHAANPTPGSMDLCMITDIPVAQVQTHLNSNQITVVEGPVQRMGAAGTLLSIYVRDPDGNLIEISNNVTTKE